MAVAAALTRLNEDLGLTVVLAEHRLERVVSHADRLIVLAQGGAVEFDGSPREMLRRADIGSLAAVLVGAPRVLLLDEPTRGMDAARKRALIAMLTPLRKEGGSYPAGDARRRSRRRGRHPRRPAR